MEHLLQGFEQKPRKASYMFQQAAAGCVAGCGRHTSTGNWDSRRAAVGVGVWFEGITMGGDRMMPGEFITVHMTRINISTDETKKLNSNNPKPTNECQNIQRAVNRQQMNASGKQPVGQYFLFKRVYLNTKRKARDGKY